MVIFYTKAKDERSDGTRHCVPNPKCWLSTSTGLTVAMLLAVDWGQSFWGVLPPRQYHSMPIARKKLVQPRARTSSCHAPANRICNGTQAVCRHDFLFFARRHQQVHAVGGYLLCARTYVVALVSGASHHVRQDPITTRMEIEQQDQGEETKFVNAICCYPNL